MPTRSDRKALKRRVFDVFFINGFVNGQDCLAKNTVNDHGQIAESGSGPATLWWWFQMSGGLALSHRLVPRLSLCVQVLITDN